MITVEKIYLSKDQSRINVILYNSDLVLTPWSSVETIKVKNIVSGAEYIYTGISIDDDGKKNNIVGLAASGMHIVSEYASLMIDDGDAYNIIAEDGSLANVNLSDGGVYKIYVGTPGYDDYAYFVSPYTFYEYKSRMIAAFSDYENGGKLARKLSTFSFLTNMLNASIDMSLDSDIVMYYLEMVRISTFGYSNVTHNINTYIDRYGYTGI